MKRSSKFLASLMTLTAFALSAGGAVAQPATCTGGTNLVQNPGFETGSFAPWVVAWPTDPFTVVTGGGHSGTRAVVLGAVPGLNSVTQHINGTVAGTVYTVCFWLKHDPVSGGQNSFEVRWGGRTLFTLIGSYGFDWTQFRFTVRATGTDALRFDAQEVPAFWHLDDVGVYAGGAAPFQLVNTVDKKVP